MREAVRRKAVRSRPESQPHNGRSADRHSTLLHTGEKPVVNAPIGFNPAGLVRGGHGGAST